MNTRVSRRKFGNTGLYVSQVSYGAMNLRLLETKEQSYEILNYVLDQGINLIDTARAYNGQIGTGETIESEVLVGEVLGARTDIDEPIVVITKGHGYNPDAFESDLSISRNKLNIHNTNDLKIKDTHVKLVYFFHGINEARWKEMNQSGVLEYAKIKQNEGFFTYLGFSSHYRDIPVIKKVIDSGYFQVMELPYNVFNRSIGEDGYIDLLKHGNEKGLGIINMKAFNGNGFVKIYPMLKNYINIDYCKMLKFCLSNPYVSTIDAGAKYVSEFASDIDLSLQDTFSNEELDQLKNEADLISPQLESLCRGCMHCLEKFQCVKEIDFPKILLMYSNYKIADLMKMDTSEFRQEYNALALNGSDCIACGKCKPWCEYKLDIPKTLTEAHNALKDS